MTEFLGLLPCLMWLAGTWMVGDLRTAGWAVLFGSEFAWIVFGWHTHIWSLVFCGVAGLVMYARNYRKWRLDEHGA